MWLFSYFIFMSTFAVVKLLRVCVLRTVPHQYYFYYVCGTTALYWICLSVWFVVGNVTFFRSLSYGECAMAGADGTDKTQYNAGPLLILTGALLGVHWFLILSVY